MNMTAEIKTIDLGCMNGWEWRYKDTGGEPPEYTKCGKECGEEYEHRGKTYVRRPIVRTNLGNCYNRYTCTKCGITYTVDSSD